MDSNSVMVLDQGNIAEFDNPDNLLTNKGTIYNSMAKKVMIAAYLSYVILCCRVGIFQINIYQIPNSKLYSRAAD